MEITQELTVKNMLESSVYGLATFKQSMSIDLLISIMVRSTEMAKSQPKCESI